MKQIKFLLFTLSNALFSIQLSAQDEPDQKKLHHAVLFQWADSLNAGNSKE